MKKIMVTMICFVAMVAMATESDVVKANFVAGTELAPALTSTYWSGTGWTIESGGKYATHTTGTTALQTTASLAPSAGAYYRVAFTMSSRTAQSVAVAMGGVTLATLSANGDYTYDCLTLSTANLTFTPTNTAFDGRISKVSVKPLTGGTVVAQGTVSGDRLISTTPVGTAPFTVTSTTVVPNLNASYLSGSTLAQVITSARASSGSPVNAVAASGTFTFNGAVADAETVTVDTEIFEFDTDGSVTAGHTTVDMSGGSEVKATGTLTVTADGGNDVSDGETVTIGTEVYEFDWDGSITAGRTLVDISGATGLAKAKGTITFSGLPTHGQSFVVGTTTSTIKWDATAGGSGNIALSACASAEFSTAELGFIGIPTDADTFTINARVYEFDSNSAITGDVAVDITGDTTIAEVLADIVTAITGDGSADVAAVAVPAGNKVTFTSLRIGTAANYAIAKSCSVAGWLPGMGVGGNMLNGANPTVEEVIDQIVTDFAGTMTVPSKTDATHLAFEFITYGTYGNTITFTEGMSNATIDGGGVLGATTAGTDASKEEGVAALHAAFVANTALPISATDNLDGTWDLSYDVAGTVGNKTTTETMSHGAWGAGALAGGTDNTKAEAKAAFLATAPTAAAVAFTDGTGDIVTVTASTKGVAGNAFALAESTANVVKSGAALTLGVDGTVGTAYEMKVDSSYLYVCTATNTIADANWRRISLGTMH